MNIIKDSRQSITDKLIDAVYLDAQKILSDNDMLKLYDSGSVVKIVNALFDMVLMKSIYESNSIVSIFDWYDSFEYLSQDILTQQVKDFYETNPKLLSDDFTLNNNFYFTDLRCFIVDMEDSLRQERQGK